MIVIFFIYLEQQDYVNVCACQYKYQKVRVMGSLKTMMNDILGFYYELYFCHIFF